ncbi:MFS transporter [Sulfitobacter pseudonitzschiae]|nr:MFS transporter [Pseudosulfitobacter pseudonitzschiae]MBM1835119.1 MFS transporter [Pseudosulfitobacter pseudonitzschiae]MBM1839992.1 MFS transporter [Pseudosulfitobacter pseudonitzschiae]MBM1844854.1 MFS transporter [Pseudosulfitobacter pseudonitzschiae]MBM1849654.1 MFS transporter [Pseudosulfitobacter pseudonitzschiae]
MLLANTTLGAAMPMLLILGGLTGLMLAPSPALATLPASVQTLAGLVAAAPFSLLMGRVGRRMGFVVGGLLTIVGALLATQAMISQSFTLLCTAHFALGAALSSFQYFRFAAGEVVEAKWQPVAISLMLTSGLIAAIGGPQLFIATKDALAPVPLAGAYATLAIIAFVGIVPLAAVRTPLPKVLVNRRGDRFASIAALRRRPIRLAVGIAAVSQGVMIFLMIPTPLAMIGCGLSEDTAGDVIRWHIVAMFAPSFFTGFLIQRFGAQTIAVTGLSMIILSALAATMGLSAVHFYGALIVLGLGWNFNFIGATTMLAAAVTESEKAAVQGVNDTMIALVSTVCAFAAGLVISGLGWIVLAMVSIAIVLVALFALALDRTVSASLET